ncbi:hypothetical protein [Nocardioides mangrovicus]|uniref:hypothetical protein n=1 Tax=Nocardioides mangrovicus TaxID=2478913 RepID=UPI0011C3C35C|nr:hypothetical protein [Nocardioides mangrovicus]
MKTLGIPAALLLLVALSAPAEANANLKPDYEVKLLLDPADVLTSGHVPTTALTSYLDLGASDTRSYQYLDTDPLDLDAEGWSVRERVVGSGDLQLDYKHRWTISDGDVDAALDQANDDGFDAADDNYDAEVDWGYGSEVLSAADDKTEDEDLPSGQDAVDVAVADIPGKLDDWGTKNWGSQVLAESRVHGPVTTHQYEGTLDGHDVDLEVVPLRAASGSGTDYLVELSFKEQKESSAASARSAAISELDDQGWLLHQDSLKTSLILDRY